jgi:hypothetical protein
VVCSDEKFRGMKRLLLPFEREAKAFPQDNLRELENPPMKKKASTQLEAHRVSIFTSPKKDLHPLDRLASIFV